MALFSADKGIVLEGKHLYGTDITPVESKIRESLAKLGTDLFPDRTHPKYLHRGFGERGIGTYTLQFGDEVTCLGERFAVLAQHEIVNGERDYIHVQLLLDGRDWDLDVFTLESTALKPKGFHVRLPNRFERDSILDSGEHNRSYSEFAERLVEKMDELTDFIEQNIGYAEVN